ncbi:MAG: restriction system-associated AAA family ATPase [SAR324 cluster bacterium]|nr:restriction system-associated AAA family ATPase [SAR324 cluster bacterium]
MKLIRLKITDPHGFRSLQPGFEYHFRREWELDRDDEFAPFICAGPNGSGKSNLLELLAAIFFHLDCKGLVNRPDLFEYNEETVPNGYREEIGSPDAFELEFYGKPFADFALATNEHYPRVLITKEIDKGPQYFILNGLKLDPHEPLQSQLVKKILPDFILAYSSGENEILSLSFFKMRFIHFDEYADFSRKNIGYSCPPNGDQPEGRLAFLDQDFSQAILLSNFILGEKSTLIPFAQEIGLEGIHFFRIILRDIQYPSGLGVSSSSTTSPATSKSDGSTGLRSEWPLLEKAAPIVNSLKSCATSFFRDDKDTLYMDFWLDEQCQKAFRAHFESPLKLFQSLQLLLALNLYSVSNQQKLEMYQSNSLYFNETIPVLPSDLRVVRFKDVILKKRGVDSDRIVYCKALSDGENQFLHTLGLCTLYRDNSVLFLLDEPDTHFNPDWRSKFISRLRDCFPTSNSFREMLITTHTPFLISDSKPEKVLVFEKDEETGKVAITRPDYNTLGASINKITMSVFNKRETIGGFAESKLSEMKSRYENGENPENLINEINETLGDSIEKILLIKTMLDIDKGGK